MLVDARVGGGMVSWIADNYADIAVLEEIFGREA